MAAGRISRIADTAVVGQPSVGIVTPVLQPVVHECVVGGLSLAPEPIGLLRDLIERVVLIALPVRSRGWTAVSVVVEGARLRTRVSFHCAPRIVVAKGAVKPIVERVAELQLPISIVLISARRSWLPAHL